MPLRTELALAAALALAALLASSRASAAASREGLPSDLVEQNARKDAGASYRVQATIGGGVGVRFNNPYRLARPLGDSAEGASLTAAYLDLGSAIFIGDPFGFQHGVVLRYDRSVQGVSQQVLTPSYALMRRGTRFEGWGRAGLPLVLTPDVGLGTELAFGGAWFVRAGVGVMAEVIGDLFFGAATPERKQPVYPVLSGQLGVVVEWERLP